MNAQLTEHDKKLWNEMAVLCDRFLRRELGLKALVSGLQGLLDAGDFRDKDLRDRWYSLWLPLDIRSATGETEWSADAAGEVEAMRSYIHDGLTADSPIADTT